MRGTSIDKEKITVSNNKNMEFYNISLDTYRKDTQNKYLQNFEKIPFPTSQNFQIHRNESFI